MRQSILRTLTPVIVALLVHIGLGEWLGLDDEAIQTLASALVAGVYYVAVRYAETHRAEFGWLLGAPGAPNYSRPDDLAPRWTGRGR